MTAITRLCKVFSAALLLFPVSAFAMGLVGQTSPTGMVLTDASHVTNPIVIQSLEINGRAYGAPPYLASTDWENPRGGNRTLTDLAVPTQDGAAIVVRANWVEAYSNRAFSAEVIVPEGELTIEDRTRETALVTVVFGRNGHLAVSTDTGPDAATGQHNGTVVAQDCGQRLKDADLDFRTRQNDLVGLDWVYSQEAKRASAPRVETPCSGGGG